MLPHCELSSARVLSTRAMRDAQRHASMLRFHLDFIHVLKYLTQRLHVYIYSMNGKFLDVCLCAPPCAAGPFVGEQGPCRFQFAEVSAGPEEGWKLIHQPSCRPYCVSSLHTQIS